MKLLQFSTRKCPCEIRVGCLDERRIVDINQLDPSLPRTLIEILRQGLMDRVLSLNTRMPTSLSLRDVNVLAPVTGMDKVLCIGLNYKDYCAERQLTPPAVPIIFNKFPSTVIGASEAVKLRTSVTQKVDWEVELVVVMGKRASNVKAFNAYNYILGYTVGQDISARDWKEKNLGESLLAKSMDTFCPIGPCITTSDEIGDPQNLNISCTLNGFVKQESNTNQQIHTVPAIIERLSSVFTLLPGDIILMGTPGGTGAHRTPPEFIRPGDILMSEIENIGVLETRFEPF